MKNAESDVGEDKIVSATPQSEPDVGLISKEFLRSRESSAKPLPEAGTGSKNGDFYVVPRGRP